MCSTTCVWMWFFYLVWSMEWVLQLAALLLTEVQLFEVCSFVKDPVHVVLSTARMTGSGLGTCRVV